MKERELLALKAKIDEAKSRVSELKGQRDYLMQELKRRWKCDSVEAAQKLIVSMEKDVAKLNRQIADDTARLERSINVQPSRNNS